jgi:putative flippase GtrA
VKELFERLMTFDINKIFYEKTENLFVLLFRYVFVGGIAFIADWGSMIALTYLGMNKYIAVAIAFVIGLIVNFILSKIFVFKEKSARTNSTGEFIAYAIIGVIGLILTEVLVALMVEIMGISLIIAKIIAAAIVLLWNFMARKLILY